VPIKTPVTPDKEDIKKRCRELIAKWGLMRREQKLKLESGAGQTAFSMLMRKADAHLK